MVGYVSPRPQAIYLSTFEKEELFICAPFLCIYRDRVLFDYMEAMRSWVMILARLSLAKTWYAEVILMTRRVGARNANLVREVRC